MPYRSIKSRAGKNSIFHKKQAYYAGKGAMAVAKASYRLARATASKLNVEYKFTDFDNNVTTSATPTVGGGQIFCINNLVEGSGPSNRDGNQVEFKNFNMHFTFAPAAVSPVDSIIRIIVFKMKAPNGATPVLTDVLDPTSPAPFTLLHYNLDNVPQGIQILSDKSYTYDLENGPKYPRKSLNIKKDVKARYQANTGALTDLSTNGVYVMVLANTRTGTGYPLVRISTRARYVDN